MSLLVPNEGELAMLTLLLSNNLFLGLFKNNLTPTDATIFGDLTAATFTGYAEATLLGGASWTKTAGAPSTATYAPQTFTCSAAGTAQTIYGYYIRDSGNKLWVCERFPAAGIQAISLVGQNRIVNPRLTLKDEGD